MVGGWPEWLGRAVPTHPKRAPGYLAMLASSTGQVASCLLRGCSLALAPSVTADLGSWLMLLQGTEPRNGCPAACSRGSCAGAPLCGVIEGTALFRE